MKKIGLVIILLLVATMAFAAASARITWKQNTADLPYLKEWVVFVGDSPNPTTELTRIPYDGAATGSYTTAVPITVTGTPGSLVKKYISLAAVSKNGNTTTKVPGQTSAGVGHLEYLIPYPDVGIPFEVIISIVVE